MAIFTSAVVVWPASSSRGSTNVTCSSNLLLGLVRGTKMDTMIDVCTLTVFIYTL